MKNLSPMDVIKSEPNLNEPIPNFLLCEVLIVISFSFFDMISQVSNLTIFHDNDEDSLLNV